MSVEPADPHRTREATSAAFGHQPVEAAQQRRLAAARCSAKEHRLTSFYPRADVADRSCGALRVGESDAIDFDHCPASSWPWPPRTAADRGSTPSNEAAAGRPGRRFV